MNHLFAQAEQQRQRRKTLEEVQENRNRIAGGQEQRLAEQGEGGDKSGESRAENPSGEGAILEQLKRIARSCQPKHSKPSMSIVRSSLEELMNDSSSVERVGTTERAQQQQQQQEE